MNLTGYEHNAVTCIGMKTDIPVINLCLQLFWKCSVVYRNWIIQIIYSIIIELFSAMMF